MSPIYILLRAVQVGWLAFLVYWLAMAIGNKRVARKQSFAGRMVQIAVGGLAFLLLYGNGLQIGLLGRRIVPRELAWIAAGAALTYAGIAFAVWARVTLGGNWSGIVTVKQDHQLITSGPYRFVRHPIYSGLLVALLGTALAIGRFSGFVAVLVAFAGWRFKWRTEEKFMVEEFGDQYEQYRRSTPAIVPFAR